MVSYLGSLTHRSCLYRTVYTWVIEFLKNISCARLFYFFITWHVSVIVFAHFFDNIKRLVEAEKLWAIFLSEIYDRINSCFWIYLCSTLFPFCYLGNKSEYSSDSNSTNSWVFFAVPSVSVPDTTRYIEIL